MARLPLPRNRIRLWTAAVLLSGSGVALAQLSGQPLDLSAFVQESLQPGGTVFEASEPLVGTLPSPLQSAELLHLLSRGSNFSGHSPTIARPFASSLAESDGNGGVGVTDWLAGNPGSPTIDTVGQLVAQSLWTQTFLYGGSAPAEVSMHVEIPELEVGLIGVAPNRSAISNTESAQASARLDSLITHADGTFTKGASFEFGLRAREFQVLLGPGTFANFADVEVIDVNAAAELFDGLVFNGDASFPIWSIDPIGTSVSLGKLEPGDILSYVYTLTAVGTTHGGEHGYLAFLGDPFGIERVEGNLVPELTVIAAVPEPSSVALLLAGLGWGAWQRRPRRG